MELIDRQTAIRNYCTEQCGCEPDDCGFTLERDGAERCSVVEFLEKQPTIDAVPVVRCKDCKHLFDGEHNANCCEILMGKAKWLTEITVDENWYCKDWERRTDG